MLAHALDMSVVKNSRYMLYNGPFVIYYGGGEDLFGGISVHQTNGGKHIPTKPIRGHWWQGSHDIFILQLSKMAENVFKHCLGCQKGKIEFHVLEGWSNNHDLNRGGHCSTNLFHMGQWVVDSPNPKSPRPNRYKWSLLPRNCLLNIDTFVKNVCQRYAIFNG